jgi:hypothetical protein
METAQDYYRAHGRVTAPGANAAVFEKLPRDIKSLTQVLQGVLIHRDIAPWLYSLKLPPEQYDIANLRPVAAMLSEIKNRDARPLGDAREPAGRMPCVCWHFSTVLAAVLREQGVPARARCGFGAYFNPGKYEDHWVGEYWNAADKRWILVDAQLDATQRAAFKPDFDTLDVPHDRFILAGDAWQMCRAGKADPNLFGLSFLKEQGMWWIAGNLIRDLAALNRMEMLPWDVWGIMPKPTDEISDETTKLLDRLAALTLGGDDALPALLTIYEDPRLRVPQKVFNASRQKEETLAI